MKFGVGDKFDEHLPNGGFFASWTVVAAFYDSGVGVSLYVLRVQTSAKPQYKLFESDVLESKCTEFGWKHRKAGS